MKKVKDPRQFGVAYDGDADRLGVVDEKSRVIWGDLLMCLFWREILEKHPGAPAIVEWADPDFFICDNSKMVF